MKLFTTVIGTNHQQARSRIWIEGARLVESGFVVGAKYTRSVTPSGIVLQLDPAGKYKVSGKGVKPIIDITGSVVRNTFPLPAQTVDVGYMNGSICIVATPAN